MVDWFDIVTDATNGQSVVIGIPSGANRVNHNLYKDGAIETTMRFKYIRSLEALFEATPQAVLQLVYLMRTGQFGSVDNPIFVISILQ